MKFNPKPLPTTVCLLLFVALVSLGFWQWSRYHFKKVLITQFRSAQFKKPINLAELTKLKEKAFQHVLIKGRFIKSKDFLLQHRYHNNKLGFEVISPLKAALTNKVVLVDRGWVPASRALKPLNKLAPLSGLKKVSGYVLYPHKDVFTLGKNIMRPDEWPLQIQKIDVTQIEQILGRPVYPFVIYLDAKSKHGFVREWKLAVVKPERHFGYMIQWFAMAFALLIAYLAFSCKRKG